MLKKLLELNRNQWLNDVRMKSPTISKELTSPFQKKYFEELKSNCNDFIIGRETFLLEIFEQLFDSSHNPFYTYNNTKITKENPTFGISQLPCEYRWMLSIKP